MMALSPSVTSEVGRLREVIVHRPGLELRRLTPANKAALLFDELVWVAKAQEEHDRFVELLAAHGVHVHRLADLLADLLADAAVRALLLDGLVTVERCGVELAERVRGHLDDLDPATLAEHLLGGLTVAELPGAADSFVSSVLGAGAFLLPPLPNAVFTRDPSAWIGDGVALAVMQRRARQVEQALWAAVYRHHRRFAAGMRTWYGPGQGLAAPATLEGGDVLVLSPRCVAVGMSERSQPVAVQNLAAELFAAGAAEWVLAIDLPKTRGQMHLDTVLSVVDTDAVVLWPRLDEVARCYRITCGAGAGLQVAEEPSLRRALAEGLEAGRLRVVTTGEDEVTADREQWDDGNNTLALRPGVVVAYERNVDTNRRLAEAGIEVHASASFELPRGRGGPRCMACPLVRDPIGP